MDIQEGLINLVRDFDATAYHHQAIAHAAIAEAFDIPVVMTTSADTGRHSSRLSIGVRFISENIG